MIQLVDVILPIPLRHLFSYKLPSELVSKAQIGNRAIVQFGKKKMYTAIIYRIYEGMDNPEIKPIIDILDDTPLIIPFQIKLWEWISSYYMCSIGDVYRAAVPTSLKLESETFIALDSVGSDVETNLTKHEFSIIDYLKDQEPNKYFRIEDFEKICGIKNILPHISSLQKKQIIKLKETLEQDYKDKEQDVIEQYKDFSEKELNLIFEGLKKAPKQYQAFLDFIALNKTTIDLKEFKEITKIKSNIINELINKNILKKYKVKVNRNNYEKDEAYIINKLSVEQEQALQAIRESFLNFDITLLHGVTGSGKTEIYIHLIQECLSQGKQVLYLLPEIALTTQITDRLKNIFGNELAVYHSKFNEKERAETWSKLRKKESRLILGARSSVFLPFEELGLIIIDEEHETSYKQQDPAPRYNAKNTALVLASMHKAKTLLGTATPSIETFYSCSTQRYGLVNLNNRFNNNSLPDIIFENTRELKRKKQMKSVLSPNLIQAITSTLEKERQVILFQNRRGFAPYIECNVCGWTPNCNKCDVSLTFHKKANILVCHYCGSVFRVPDTCPNCENSTLEAIGYGTERIEQEVLEIFPQAKVSRMDLDTTRGKYTYEKMIRDFASNKTNILIGTQMVSKGLDFEKVDIVGVINANSLFNYPNFRAYEKAFQMLTQVSGRAGRKEASGKVYIQTSDIDNKVIKLLKNNDYHTFYKLQLQERKIFKYPPFCRLIEIIFKSKDENLLNEGSKIYATLIRQVFGDRILGPSRPPVSKVQFLYIRKVILKIENNAAFAIVREHLEKIESQFFNSGDFRAIYIYYDVDPY